MPIGEERADVAAEIVGFADMVEVNLGSVARAYDDGARGVDAVAEFEECTGYVRLVKHEAFTEFDVGRVVIEAGNDEAHVAGPQKLTVATSKMLRAR